MLPFLFVERRWSKFRFDKQSFNIVKHMFYCIMIFTPACQFVVATHSQRKTSWTDQRFSVSMWIRDTFLPFKKDVKMIFFPSSRFIFMFQSDGEQQKTYELTICFCNNIFSTVFCSCIDWNSILSWIQNHIDIGRLLILFSLNELQTSMQSFVFVHFLEYFQKNNRPNRDKTDQTIKIYFFLP